MQIANSDEVTDYGRLIEVLMELLKVVPPSLRAKLQLAVDMILNFSGELYRTVAKLEDDRKHILSKANAQEDRIRDLQQELDALRELFLKREWLNHPIDIKIGNFGVPPNPQIPRLYEPLTGRRGIIVSRGVREILLLGPLAPPS